MAETHRMRLTVGGDRIDYDGTTKTQCARLKIKKVLINSTISTPRARFGCIDISNFYYGTPMWIYEYMKIKLCEIPDDVIEYYKLRSIAHNGYVYIEIRQGMPGLKQAGKIENDRLTQHLAKHGYAPTPHTQSLWTHSTRKITFVLGIDDFGVKYVKKNDFEHLVATLKLLYAITVDYTGRKFLGMTIH